MTPSPSSKMRSARSSKVYAVILGAWLATSPTSRAAPDEVVFVEAGEKAPFAGFLFPPGNAETIATKLETCEARRTLDAQLASDKASIQFDACNAKLKLADAAAGEREALLKKALEDAREDVRRELWEEPGLVLTAGVVLGVAATVGAVLLVGMLRPLVPAP